MSLRFVSLYIPNDVEGGEAEVRRGTPAPGSHSPIQMKEKEDRKKNEDVAKRAVHKVVQYQSDRALVPDPALLDQKELYRNKLEA